MMMDWQTGLVWLGFVVVSAGILLFISMVVTKEKSYEEAIAEQRQQNNMLLGTQNKSKLKDKKQKKAGKKVKEKLQSIINDAETAEDSENADGMAETTESTSETNMQTKHHVKFKEPQILEEPIKEANKQKDEAIKSEGDPKEKSAKQKQNANKIETNKNEIESGETKVNKKAAKHQTNEAIAENTVEKEPPIIESVVEQVTVVPQTNGIVSGANSNAVKEKKKKKGEQNTIQQLAGDKQGVDLTVLKTLVRKAELSRSEVQSLIDEFLNKQHEAPAVIDEWSEGKADPLQKLKKQLAEKEKLLSEEREALAGTQSKLKEVRNEHHAERSQLQQKLRGLEETLNSKQQELQVVNNRTLTLNQNLQALQSQLNDETMKCRKVCEENNGLQIRIQQIEQRIQQDEEIKEKLQNDLRSLTEQFEQKEAYAKQVELSQRDELFKQIEEQRTELEHRTNVCIMQDKESKAEIQKLNTACQQYKEDIRRLESNNTQSHSKLKTQHEESEKNISQLKQKLQELKEEKEEIETRRENEAVEHKNFQVKFKNLQNELSSHQATIDRLQNDLSSHQASVDRLQHELYQQKEKNDELRKKNWKVMDALNAAENRNKKTAINLDNEVAATKQHEQLQQKQMLQRLFPNIKIDDNLLYDQWVSEMESTIGSYIKDLEMPKSPEPVDNTEVVKLQAQIQKYKRTLDEHDNLLQELQQKTAETEMNWLKKVEKKDEEIAIRDKAISEQDSRISSLKEQVELLQEQINQLRLQLSQMETQLAAEKEENQRLINNSALKLDQSALNDTVLECERINEDMDRLTEKFIEEQRINNELRIQIEAINDLSTKPISCSKTSNGPSVTAENNGN